MKRATKTISVTIEETLVEKLQQEAEQENRTLSSKIRLILRGYLQQSAPEFIDAQHCESAEDTCSSCSYFEQHYIKVQGWYAPTVCGHCARPCFKIRKPSGAACEYLIPNKKIP